MNPENKMQQKYKMEEERSHIELAGEVKEKE